VKEFIFIVIIFLMLSMPLNAFAYDYVINSFDITMTVNIDNSFDIIETISAYFNVPRRGIMRNIPTRNEISRPDGTTSRNRAEVNVINVNEQFTTFNEIGYRVIRIGNPNVTITGETTYVIHYIYSIGRDTGRGYDELFFNLIGPGWDTTISNITFNITMPESFDESMLSFSTGRRGSMASENIEYSVNNRVIAGRLIGTLQPGEALTVRLELPEGYFKAPELNNSDFRMWVPLLPITLVLIYFLMWLIDRGEDVIVETIEFYPPQSFNSAEVGFMYSGSAKNEHITSLLIYLANKGYIKISESIASLEPNYGFAITKVREYDGTNQYEKIFMDGLFKSWSSTGTGVDIVEGAALKDDFYKTVQLIENEFNSKKNMEMIFTKGSVEKAFLGKAMTTGWSLIIMFILIVYSAQDDVSPSTIYLSRLLLTGASVVVSLIGFAILQKKMLKRNPIGLLMLGKIKGFINFLRSAESSKLEELTAENPQYFYDMLPYAYALGLPNTWIKKFESTDMLPPYWYNGFGFFNIAVFGSFMADTMDSTISRSESYDGGSSDGGSGGGSGGGGGSSW